MAKINMHNQSQLSMFATYSTKGYFPLPRNVKKIKNSTKMTQTRIDIAHCTEKDSIRLCVLQSTIAWEPKKGQTEKRNLCTNVSESEILWTLDLWKHDSNSKSSLYVMPPLRDQMETPQQILQPPNETGRKKNQIASKYYLTIFLLITKRKMYLFNEEII